MIAGTVGSTGAVESICGGWRPRVCEVSRVESRAASTLSTKKPLIRYFSRSEVAPTEHRSQARRLHINCLCDIVVTD